MAWRRGRADLTALAEVAAEIDWSVAQETVALIESRGFNRGRDLQRALLNLQGRRPH